MDTNECKATAWESLFTEMVLEQGEIASRGEWTVGAEDLLGIIGRARRELYHCAILAWLMSPMAPHGLGNSFLTGFLRHLKEKKGADLDLPLLDNAPWIWQVKAQTEVSRRFSRADIVITAPGLCLVIEAKVDAKEQERQCDRLYDDWKDEEGPAFVFLTPTGAEPSTATGNAALAFRSVGFGDIRRILGQCVSASTLTINPAVATYQATLQKEFR